MAMILLTHESIGDRLVIGLEGEFDLASVETFEDGIAPLLNAQRSVLVDLSRLSFMDSSGLSTLLRLQARLAASVSPVELRIRPGEGQPARVLNLSGVDGRLKYVE